MWKRRSVRLLFVLCPASLLLFGCYNPDKIGNGQLGCSPTSTCPDNFYCASDHYCWRNGTGPDLAAPLDLAVDASPNDAAPDAPPAVEMAVDMTSVELAVDSGAADSAIDAHLFDASVLDLHPDAQSVDAAGDMARVDMTRLDMTACCASDSDCN
ncbi:MAG TPA: hypothetical protein VKW77_05720, partial [Acidimicrobiales bacterium]|nr:hypothetical protein [Acidimicrobiales bacterium]